MKNNTFEEIAKVILEKEQILIYPHINVDGDGLGSATALCKAIRQMGKNCYVLVEDNVPGNLAFLDKGYVTFDENIIATPDLSICVDCGDPTRFPKRQAKFESAETTLCIDHHRTTKNYCHYNYVDSSAAATGELIYDLLQAMGTELDQEIGEAIFAAITTDTGNFQYSNTSKKSHEIMAKLYDAGIDANKVSIELYENQRIQKILIKSKVLSTLELIAGGKGALCYMTEDMLAETGATADETEGVVQEMRSIDSVEIAAFLKENGENKVKVSLRSKKYADVTEIAGAFGGGGHTRAAGCTLTCSMAEAFDVIKGKIIELLERP
ncbi:MAG: bifunctional oligoribonuclease/PAP phosphatase NrnA [Firmicutes bacterium]|nr:bifunctional oligoribonuclease/PAP phosphatase NrnA [Bacillota bacterium]